MPKPRPPAPPMTLGKMRENGVRSLNVDCLACGHQAMVNMDAYPEDLTVQSFADGTWKTCSKCGSKKIRVMPAWQTKSGKLPLPRFPKR